MSTALFWLAAGLVAYVYLGFPLLLWLRSRVLRRPFQRSGDHTPTVGLVLCAHNEAAGIRGKLDNIGRLDYPRERLEVIVASDGSSDGTEARVRERAAEGIRLLALPRRGKIATLNAAVAETSAEILVFSDANSIYEPDALRALTRPFADLSVGGVAGDQRYVAERAGSGADRGERTYWDLDRLLKQWQSRSGSVTSATGAIYAIRRSLFREVPSGVTDDFWISSNVVAQGYRLVFAGDAVAWEPPARSAGDEFQRKVRVITRGLRGISLMRELFDPRRHGFYSLQLLSHKLLRRLVFVPLAVLLVTSILSRGESLVYALAAAAQLGFYAVAALRAQWPAVGRIFRGLDLPFYFCMVNVACAVAVLNTLRGERIDSWEPLRQVAAPAAAQEQPGAGTRRS